MVAIVTSLCSNSLQNTFSTQVNLQPLAIIADSGHPAAAESAVVSRLQPSRPGPVVTVGHWGGGEHRLRDAAILDSQGDVTLVCDKKWQNLLKQEAVDQRMLD